MKLVTKINRKLAKGPDLTVGDLRSWLLEFSDDCIVVVGTQEEFLQIKRLTYTDCGPCLDLNEEEDEE